ncbi:MAG: PqqD family protein [Alloprevotella sp.]|nr:PqqD family protein [Alloprevotella sp.]
MRIKKDFELRDICGNKTIIAVGEQNIDFNSLIALNDTGAELWEEAIQGDFTIESLVSYLKRTYNEDEAMLRKDVQALVAEWARIGLLEDEQTAEG